MRHIAFIMDGNGRWAEQQGMPRVEGHKAGAEALLRAIDSVDKNGIEYTTFYAFSQENFKRDESEIKSILKIITTYLKEYVLPLARERKYRIRFIGELNLMPDALLGVVNEINAATINNHGKTFTFAICYGGDAEVAYAFNKLLKLVSDKGRITPADIRENLYTANMPDPDVVVRYGGYKRLSNFMPLQTSYSELVFFDKFWPDFCENDLEIISNEFNSVKRNFGG